MRTVEYTLDALRSDPDPALVRSSLGHASGLVVARAVELVSAAGDRSALAELEGHFDRFVDRGAENDPSCRAKVAILEALDAHDVPALELFARASRLRQWEKAWGPPVDTATGVRGAAMLGLVHQGHDDALDFVVDGLADPEARVRSVAAVAAGDSDDPGAARVLRFKLRTGDEEPEVLADAMSSLLRVSPASGRKLAIELLSHGREKVREAIGLTLGERRVAGAWGPLRDWWARSATAGERRSALLAMALLRDPEGEAFLLELVRVGSLADARDALRGLATFAFDEELVARVRQALSRTALEPSFAEHFEA